MNIFFIDEGMCFLKRPIAISHWLRFLEQFSVPLGMANRQIIFNETFLLFFIAGAHFVNLWIDFWRECHSIFPLNIFITIVDSVTFISKYVSC